MCRDEQHGQAAWRRWRGESWLAERQEGRRASCSPGDPEKLWGSVEAEGVKRLPVPSRTDAGMRLTSLQAPSWATWEDSGSQIGLTLGAGGGLKPGPARPSRLTPPRPVLLCLPSCSQRVLPTAIQRPKETGEICTSPGCVIAGEPPAPPQPCPGPGLPMTLVQAPRGPGSHFQVW